MEIKFCVTAREAFEEPEKYYAARDAAMKEGSLSLALNEILKDAIDEAVEEGFCATAERGLGDFILEKHGPEHMTDAVLDLLTVGGLIYFMTASYPFVYASDADENPIDISEMDL